MSDNAKIKSGIEWFEVRDGDEEPFCARCGSSCSFVNCWECHGEGTLPVSDWEGIDHGETDECPECEGTGGEYHCLSTPAWCRDNPIPGRESIESTAMNGEAWRDCM